MGGQIQLNHRLHLKLAWDLLRKFSPEDVEYVLSTVLPILYEGEQPHLHGYRPEGTKKWVRMIKARMLDGEKFEEFVGRCPEFWDLSLPNK